MAKNEQSSALTPETKRRRRERYAIVFIGIFLIGLFILEWKIIRGGTNILLPNNIIIIGLINLNLILFLLLIFLVLRNFFKLLYERHTKVPWYKLRTKLVIAFVLFTIIPTLFLFVISANFIMHSTDRWFSAQIESSQEHALDVAETYNQENAQNALYFAKRLSDKIIEQKVLADLNYLNTFINFWREQYHLGSIEVLSNKGERLGISSAPDIPNGGAIEQGYSFIKDVLAGKTLSTVEPFGEGDIIRGVVPILSPIDSTKADGSTTAREVAGVVIVNHYVPKSLKGKMVEIAKAYDEYKQLELHKNPIKTSYLMVLLLITLLIMFSATWFGFYLSKEITTPIHELVEGTQKIAHGDLNVHINVDTDDEIGYLVKSFNKMTDDLKMSQQGLEKANIGLRNTNEELEQRRRYMEIVLKNVAAGVVSLDRDGRITTINTSAERLLGIKTQKVLNKKYREVLSQDHMELVKDLLRVLNRSTSDTIEREVQIKLKDKELSLLVSLTVLKDEKNNYLGMVVVFEDLTQLIKTQRIAAWREVAKRIAHEIKNPLTPIQLSAQRLRRKYLEKITDDKAVFDECTDTIIKQVDELKGLVDEFSSFAQLPAITPQPSSLNSIISEALVLYKEAHKNIQFDFVKDERMPIFNLDRDQVKRVMINLLDNAVAAIYSIDGGGTVTIRTKFDELINMASVEVSDTGCGIAPQDKPRLFEPYFSTKKAGTGLGLAIVDRIVKDHNGIIRVHDNVPKGATFIIEFPVNAKEELKSSRVQEFKS